MLIAAVFSHILNGRVTPHHFIQAEHKITRTLSFQANENITMKNSGTASKKTFIN